MKQKHYVELVFECGSISPSSIESINDKLGTNIGYYDAVFVDNIINIIVRDTDWRPCLSYIDNSFKPTRQVYGFINTKGNDKTNG